MKTSLGPSRLFCGIIFIMLLFGAASVSANPSVFPTGTTVYDPQKAYNSYIAFAAPDGKTHLIDMDGNEVHHWDKWGFPSEILNPAIAGGKKGELIVQLSKETPSVSGGAAAAPQGAHPVFGGIFANKSIGELDWNGNTVWEWGEQAPAGAARQNHDWARLPNGNTIIVATADRVVPSLSKKPVADQVFYEIRPKGDIVWTWYVADHISEFGFSPEGLRLLSISLADGNKGHGFLTINDMQPIGPNKWFDAGDQRFAPDNIVIDSREASFIAIIDKKTGKIVWRIGPDYVSSEAVLRPTLSLKVPRPVDQTSGQHNAHIIPKGLPGGGDLLVFDNEGASGFPPTTLSMFNGSRVLEIDPTTKQIVWQYTGLDSDAPLWSFNSSFISSARRLPNGNTVIDEGMNGRIFQVTPQGEIVWEYVNPYFGRQTLAEGRAVSTNWVYRAQPVPYDWVPDGTPRSEKPVRHIDNATFRVPDCQ
jgi:Arylsulfotransferase (ASST)